MINIRSHFYVKLQITWKHFTSRINDQVEIKKIRNDRKGNLQSLASMNIRKSDIYLKSENVKKLRSIVNSLTASVPHHIETSQLICSANLLTDFYMMRNMGRQWVNG